MKNLKKKIKTPEEKTRTHRRCKNSKKVVLYAVTALCMCAVCSITCFAVDTTEFISKVETALKVVVTLIGAGLGLWGIINLLEGYGNDNPGAKSQGMKQLMAGLAVVAVGVILVPVLTNMMTSGVNEATSGDNTNNATRLITDFLNK